MARKPFFPGAIKALVERTQKLLDPSKEPPVQTIGAVGTYQPLEGQDRQLTINTDPTTSVLLATGRFDVVIGPNQTFDVHIKQRNAPLTNERIPIDISHLVVKENEDTITNAFRRVGKTFEDLKNDLMQAGYSAEDLKNAVHALNYSGGSGLTYDDIAQRVRDDRVTESITKINAGQRYLVLCNSISRAKEAITSLQKGPNQNFYVNDHKQLRGRQVGLYQILVRRDFSNNAKANEIIQTLLIGSLYPTIQPNEYVTKVEARWFDPKIGEFHNQLLEIPIRGVSNLRIWDTSLQLSNEIKVTIHMSDGSRQEEEHVNLGIYGDYNLMHVTTIHSQPAERYPEDEIDLSLELNQ